MIDLNNSISDGGVRKHSFIVMRTFFGVSLLATLFAPALGEKIEPAVALIDLSEEDKDLLETG